MVNINHFKKSWKNYLIGLLLILFIGNIFLSSNFGISQMMSQSFDNSISSKMISSSERGMIVSDAGFAPNIQERKVIKNANLNLETNDYDKSYNQIKNSINTYNVIILSESEYKDNNLDRNLNLNLKIDSTKLDSILSEIKMYGEITNLNIYSDDVTGTYSDYTNRSIRYQTQIEKYYLMLNRINITIQEEIDVQQRIDQLEDQIFYLEDSKSKLQENVDYSSLYINLKEKPSFIDESNFLGLKDGIMQFLRSLDSGIQFILQLIGFVIPFVIIYAIYRISRKLIKN